MSNDISSLIPGFVKIHFKHRGNPFEELALVMSPPIADGVGLSTDILCYRPFLRDCMKAAFATGGMNVYCPISGYDLRRDYVTDVKGSVITLTDSFSSLDNFKYLLVPGNSPYFRPVVDELKRKLTTAGFPVERRKWDDYKAWEEATLKTMS